MRRSILVAILAIAPTVAVAQVPSIVPGARVRVDAHQRTLNGILTAQTADSIVVETSSAPRTAVALESVARIRVNAGRSRSEGAARGLKLGSAIGAGGAAIFFGGAYLASSEANKNPAWLLGFIAGGAVMGALYGSVIGALLGAERWVEVYSSPVRLGVFTSPNGSPRIGLSLGF